MTDFRNRIGSQYDSQGPNYSRPTSSSGHPMYGQPTSLYPKIGGAAAHSANPLSASGPGRNPPFHHAPSPPSSSGIGIRVAIKPEYRITPPPQLLPQVGEIPRCNFHFDFEFERNVLDEAVKENPNWRRLGIEIVPPKTAGSSSSYVCIFLFKMNFSLYPDALKNLLNKTFKSDWLRLWGFLLN
ncbi:Hypothetical predicted protein [Olea europaea subsp. europaea]|uniref:Uncharacterized protein n=1 Tax=Olea europaea subsp. europaea TaxID=158383 RepID=A0A8S0QRK4_OLEEU|nr:Hypothetical predicted protein [Olea europaea subsp. europaea]